MGESACGQHRASHASRSRQSGLSMWLCRHLLPTWDLDWGGVWGCDSQSGGFLLLCLSGKGIERRCSLGPLAAELSLLSAQGDLEKMPACTCQHSLT